MIYHGNWRWFAFSLEGPLPLYIPLCKHTHLNPAVEKLRLAVSSSAKSIKDYYSTFFRPDQSHENQQQKQGYFSTAF